MEKKIANFRLKKNILIGSVIACIATATIGIGIIHTKVTGNSNINVAKKVGEEPQAITISTREKNSNNYTAVISEDDLEVPVPKGYVASPDAEERYVNGVTTDGVRVHHGGFVIYERLASDAGKTDEQVQQVIEGNLDVAQRTRNQWVWVPITNVTDMYHTSGNLIYANQYTFSASTYTKNTSRTYEPNVFSSTYYDRDNNDLKQYLEGISRNEFLQEMREEFYEMLESVKTYKGYYIGRYETGNTQKNNLRVVKGYTGTMRSGDVNNRINYITWYDAYRRSKRMRGMSPVYTNLIWGIQWDETLKWLIDSGEKTYAEVGSNSSTWGNYQGVSFTYTQTSGVTADGAGTVAGGTATKSNSYTIIPTVATERNKANNIYDLAGNMVEWTMESTSDTRQFRGGEYYGFGNSVPAHYRSGNRSYFRSDNVRV